MNQPYSIFYTAFSLVETTLALGICIFCLLAILGLLPEGVKRGKTAMEQTAASGLLSVVAVDLRETPQGAGVSHFFQIPFPSDPRAGSTEPEVRFFRQTGEYSTTAEPSSRYRLTVIFLSNGGAARLATLADVQMTWPAQAAPEAAAGRVRTLVALDRN